MKKNISSVFITILLLTGFPGVSEATLITIGTAEYQGSDYKLIWDDDNNGNSVVWFDYSYRGIGNWTERISSPEGLDSILNYSLDPIYTVIWNDDTWRLPNAGVNPRSGFNQVTSEMGDLFYNELKLRANMTVTDTELNATNFDNLIANGYWYYKEWIHDPFTWYFDISYGYQDSTNGSFNFAGLAIRSGDVTIATIPESSTILLLGLGLLGLAGATRKKIAM